mgnify:CR=1 FL=1
MIWNVYNYNFNAHKIEKFNIFDHGGFAKYFGKHIRTIKNKAEFAEAVRKELFYYYGSKAEWELVVKLTEDNRVFLYPWCGSSNPDNEKIEVTNETNFDWLGFAKQHIGKQIYKNETKIDVSDQVRFQFDEFIDYMWSCKAR